VIISASEGCLYFPARHLHDGTCARNNRICTTCGWDHSKHVAWECTKERCGGCGHSLVTFKVTVTRLTDNSVVSEEQLCYSCYQKENS
jgi:hypothetical protein